MSTNYKLRANDKEIKDVLYLIVFYGMNYVPSFVTLPYLSWVLGAENFGHIGFSLALCQFLMIVVDFGFNMSVTKRIALVREDKDAVDRIFSAAFYSRFFLLFICFVAVILISYIPSYSIYRQVLFAKFVSVIGEAFCFIFLFQGLGYVRWISIMNCVAKFMVLPFMFLLVKGPDDYILAAMLPGIISCVADMLLVGMMCIKRWVRLVRFNIADCITELKSGFRIFISNAGNNLYLSIIVMLLAYFATPAEVGIYTFSDKIIRAVVSLLFVPITQSFYPAVSRMAEKSRSMAGNLVNKLILVEAVLMGCAILCIFMVAPYIPQILGADYNGIETIIRIMSLMTLAIGIGGVCGQLGLLAIGGERQKRHYSNVYVLALSVAVLGAYLFPPCSALRAGLILLLTELVVALLMSVLYLVFIRSEKHQ